MNEHEIIMQLMKKLKFIGIVQGAYGSPLFRSHYEWPTNPQGIGEEAFNGWWNNIPANRQSDPFQDANEYGYGASQLSHLPILNGYDHGKLLSYIPLYGNRTSTKDLITALKI